MKKIALGGLLVAALACQAAAQGKLTEISASKSPAGVELSIKGNDLNEPKIMRVNGGSSFMLEFDAQLTGKPQTLNVKHAGVTSVQSTWYKSKPPKVRVHVKLDPNSKLRVLETGDGWNVMIGAPDKTAKAPATTPIEVVPADKAEGLVVGGKKGDIKHSSLPPIGGSAQAVAVGGGKPAYKPAPPKEKIVSLDFVNTDVVQILKALAMQANVNIVTSPEVKGNLTVSLGAVTITEALDLVTTLSGLRYAKVGKTFVVTGGDKFSETMRRIGADVQPSFETRVVPIFSGEGTQIKAALLKSMPMDGKRGNVEIALPSEEVSIAQKSNVGEMAANGNGEKKDEGTTLETKTAKQNGTKDPYVVLIGPSQQLNDLERMVKMVDNQICNALGIEVPTTSAMVRNMYRPKGSSAQGLLMAVAGSGAAQSNGQYRAKVGSVEMFATPGASISDQVIVLYGRETEVNMIMENLRSLDQVADSRGDYLVYDVKNLDPRALREELIVQVPGLSVSIPPASAGNTNLYRPDAIKTQGTETMGGTGVSTMGDQNAATQASQTSLSADSGNVTGITLPFQSMERNAVPMKLVLRGSRDQIQRALNYLEAIDTAPRQVALELRVMELSREEALRVGLDWSILTGGTVQSLRVDQGLGGPGVSTRLGFPGGGLADITATLDQISNRNNLIARPNLLAIDGRESEIFVGDVVRYIEQVQATQNGVTVTTGQVPVGVRLAVLPRIGGDGTVTMDLRPVVSTLNGFTPVPGGGQIPQTSLRVAQSTMLINSGETIAIGGLIQDQDRKRAGGIPILKDLPLIGHLFKRTDNSRIRTEIVFFLTAKVVDRTNRQNAAHPRSNDPATPKGPMGGIGQ